jgi:uncharacterized protein YecE (DUF72 family)
MGEKHERPSNVAIRIGCSGWNYKSWRGRFYPSALPSERWLPHYSERFDTVELNGSFYRLPTFEMFERWRTQTPEDFVMAVKASRFLTHMKRLRDPEEPLMRLFDSASGLGDRLGPVLYQLPANFHCNLDRLSAFLKLLPTSKQMRAPHLQHVMEFRHVSWYVPRVFQLLDAFGVGLCWHDKHGSGVVEPVTGPLVYVRFHGTSGHYRGSYGLARLTKWARRLVELHQQGYAVYAYFNNDPDAVATENAQTLKRETTTKR